MRFDGTKLLVSLFVVLLSLPAVRATTLVRLSLDQLAAGSDAVVRVRFTARESHWENGSIWTITTATVLETVKGSPPQEIAVRLPGGRVGHLTSTVDGTPRFHPGEEAYLFLGESRAGGYTVAGWVEGTFRISRDARTGGEMVTQDSSAFAVFDPSARAFHVEGIRRLPIAEFRARIAAGIARSEEKSR